MRPTAFRHAAAFAAALLLSACAGFSPDGGLAGVDAITAPALGHSAVTLRTPDDAAQARARVNALLRQPLSADRAVQVALVNNRDLQAAYNALGLSEAALVQARLPPNPTFSVQRIAGGGVMEIESRIVANLLGLATLPVRAEIAADRFRQAQLQAAGETLRIAADARRAFHRAVAARALVTFLTQALKAGEAAAQLGRRLGETGAIGKLDQARSQLLHAELAGQLATARLRAASERERLVRALGLWGDDLAFGLPAQLPPLPARVRSLAGVEVEAVRRRVDLQLARIEVDLLAKSHGLAGATRFLNLLEVAGVAKNTRENGETTRERGFEVEFQVPLFDFGDVKVRQAEQAYLQAVNRLVAKAVTVRSQAREAYQGYRAAYDIARHYRREVLPLRKIIADETLLRYNAMQIDVFVLLGETRQRIASTTAAIEAEREFWLAETNLGAALLGGNTEPSAIAVVPRPKARAIDPEIVMKLSRRNFVGASAATLAGVAAVAGRAQAARIPEAAFSSAPVMQPPLAPPDGQPYRPVVTLNGWTLPWRMQDGWKEFHLVAEPVVREMAPGMKAHLWGYNGASPGPTIEAVEGDRVRIFVTNRLPEHTTVHWHGMLVPNGMDGVGGLTQPHIKPGKTFVYEFVLKKSGTFMYHPHADEMVQMAMGMMGSFIVHPRDPQFMPVDRDFVFLLQSYDIDPGSYLPRVMTMTEFNLWAWNSRVFPGIDPLVVRQGDRVRVRVGNLTMTNHPIHMHGYHFAVTCTDGGWIPESARWPEVSIDVPVGAMRAYEFVADEPGDWAIHCHKSHHTMNAMGHEVRNFIGVNKKDVAKTIRTLVPDYMPMGSAGMAEMGAMEMPMPDNTLPMMTGFGQFGPMEMGGMFSVVKVRAGLARDDYADPGPYRNPEGTVAYEVAGAAAATPARKPDASTGPAPAEFNVVKPGTRRPTGHRH